MYAVSRKMVLNKFYKIKVLPHPKPHLTLNIPVYPDVYPTSINIPKHFTVMLYSKFKKLWIVKFIRTQRKDYEMFDIDVVLSDQGKQSHTIDEFAPCENLI